MGYRVKGTLKLPDGTPGTNCEIEFTSRKNFTPMLTGMGVSIRTDSTGAYDVTLEYGAYAVILRTDNTYPSAIGQLTVGPDTVAGQDLPTLLEKSGWQPATPEYIQQITEWLDRAESAAVSSEASAVKSATDGAAHAAIAKSQADRAKSEADRASQISGLDTVSDAIGMAALPLPDVWAPLSDSLRMITGYGREVKVGDDVVARMVNFSRSTTATYIGKDGKLKTATANEPRFEKEGLLIEGQSTNTLQNSTAPNTTYQVTKTEDVTAPDGVSVASTFTNTQAANYIRFGVIVPGANTATITGSIWIKAVSGSGQLTADVDGMGTVIITPTSEWVRYSFTRSGEAASANIIDIRFVAGHNNLKIAVWGAQREVGPIATSLIPTNGQAVTRAADVCWVDKNNLPTGGFSVAVNFESRCVSVNPADSNYSKLALLSTNVSNSSIKLACGKDTASGITTGAYGWAKNTAGAITYFTGSHSVQIPRYQGCMKLAVSSIRCRFGVNDEFVSAAGLLRGFDPTDILLGAYRIFGSAHGVQHIRNLRIWHLDLTDDQLKAVA